jgi:predicted ATPase
MLPEQWDRVKELYEAALERDAAQRTAFLQNEKDPVVRDEVLRLLGEHHQLGDFLSTPAYVDPRNNSAASENRLPPGQLLAGRFRILNFIAAGGMGEVYQAQDTRLNRTVALKILPGHLSQKPDLRQRLEREAQTISRLSHPNICTIFDVGEYDGRPFLAMEFIQGITLRQHMTAGNIPLRKIIPIAVQIADGLAKAHELSIIHRDLKPENAMISDDTVKILDFGLAKLSQDRDGDCTTAISTDTQAGVILGTIEYMSPEQASGRPLDFRSDQFSFGVVLYEMVTGRRAFRRGSVTQTLLAIVSEQPESIAALNPEAPPPLCWIIERCLAKDPHKRYGSTRDLARDLAALRDRFSALHVKRVDTRPSNLPVPNTEFIGRDTERAAARALLLRKDIRLVTITGPGGIGKSRLALEVARDVASGEHSFEVYFVPLAAVSEPGLIASVIAQTLGVRETGGQSTLDALKEYLQHLPRSPLLLMLDNFEHLVSAAPMLAELLALAPSLKLLVTSRAPLHVYHEHEFPVPPLALPDAHSLPSPELLAQYSAIRLFVQRAAAVKPDFRLNSENAAAVTAICARLDGLPLAIELAAARVKLLSPSAIHTRLASRLQLLTGGPRDLPARQQTLRQAIDWSYDLLNANEQKLFRRLSVFAGGCTLEAVESVCDAKRDLGLDVLDGMASMVDKSLARQIEQADGEPRFIMLETIREYGLAKLAESGEEPLTRRAHAAYCLVLAEEGAAEDAGKNPNAWLDRFEIEHDNFRAALEWLTETANSDWGLRLGGALFRFWETREYLSEGRDRLEKLLKLPAATSATKPRMRALFAAGVLASGDYLNADALIEESLQIARQLQDKQGTVVSLNGLAILTRDRGELADSQALFEESLVLWRELRDPLAVARALSNLANVVKLRCEYQQARSLYQESRAIFNELNDRTGIAWTLNHEGDVAREQGDSQAARSLYQASLEAFRELGDRWGIAGSLSDLGHLAREEGDFRAADSLYRESIALFRELDHKRGVARLLESFACLAAAQSEPERSLRLAGAAAALRKSLGAPLTPAEQAKLETSLEPARKGLTTTGGAAWLEGWVMPIEKAVEEALKPGSAAGA